MFIDGPRMNEIPQHGNPEIILLPARIFARQGAVRELSEGVATFDCHSYEAPFHRMVPLPLHGCFIVGSSQKMGGTDQA
jgi:hypothetical protein